MFRRRDHESFIGGYDPEREMPNPDREYRDRYQSDAYRHNSADSRWAYRWNPDRFEERFASDREREFFQRGYDAGYRDRDYDRERERDRDRWDRWEHPDRDRDYLRGRGRY
ncbi:MAG TPA: hypothetical protein VJ901_04260 [Thermoanaerobaculia bacterium]|nr:hypothetical protein [Thermoanaerobaculia bacterium]